MKTKRLYETAPYQKSMEAVVKECRIEEKTKLILDQTVFYPEGGGQPGDQGWLYLQAEEADGETEKVRVLDTQEEDGMIVHMVDHPVAFGTKVRGEIDWETRYGYMQNHTGEHMVSGCVHKKYGYDNVGFHMGKDAVVIDFNGELNWDQLQEIEEEVNRGVDENVPVAVTYPSEEELSEIPYRSKKEIQGQVRIVTISGYDICACCGIHVAATAEVQMVKILSVQNHRGGVRVEMICGKDAREDYRKKHVQSVEVARALSVKPYEISEAVRRMTEENIRLKMKFSQVQSELAAEKIGRLEAGKRAVVFREDGKDSILGEGWDPNQVRRLVNLAREKAVHVLTLTKGNKEREYRYIIGSGEDAGVLAKRMNERFAGRGGGSAMMTQGSLFGEAEEMEAYFLELTADEADVCQKGEE
ncbi:MAG: alanyl-tRNA editing protein [Lachnospiraceae bacterium]|nr:hypothetical protein [Candidatus Fimimorpha excrementavium]